MKVGIHADPINHRIPGGVGVYVRRLVEHLLATDERDNLHLLAVSKVAADPTAWWRPGRTAATLPLKALYASWNYLGMPPVGGQFDVVHATALVIPPARKARLVATIHDLAVDTMPEVVPSPWRQIYRKGLHVAIKRAAVICTVTQAIKEQIISRYSIDPDKVMVTPEAANHSPADFRDEIWFDHLELDGPFILNVGTVEPRKNQQMLVRALAAAGTGLAGHRLIIAGAPGWGEAALSSEIDRLSLRDRVLVLGEIGDSQLSALYSKAAAFAMPSLYEGFGLPLLEALAFGVPAACSKDPALSEVAGQAALMVDAEDEQQWADALVRLVADEDLRTRFAEEGPIRAGQFNWKQTAALTIAAYHKATSA